MRWSEQSGGSEGERPSVRCQDHQDRSGQPGRQTDKAEGRSESTERERGESARVESGFSPVPAGKEEEEGLC